MNTSGVDGGKGQHQPRAITSVTELEKLISSHRIFLADETVSLDLEGMPADSNRQWQDLVNSELTACGCREGGFLAVVFLIVYTLFLLFSGSASAMSGLSKALFGLGIAVGGTVIGKLLGLHLARRRLVRTVSQLRAVVGFQQDG